MCSNPSQEGGSRFKVFVAARVARAAAQTPATLGMYVNKRRTLCAVIYGVCPSTVVPKIHSVCEMPHLNFGATDLQEGLSEPAVHITENIQAGSYSYLHDRR